MRNIKYGKFADTKMPSRDDWMDTPIGFHNATRREEKRVLDSIRDEYYMVDEKTGKNLVVTDPTIMEKVLARAKHVFQSKKKKVVGYRDDGEIGKQHTTRSLKEDSNKWQVNVKPDINKESQETQTHSKVNDDREIV